MQTLIKRWPSFNSGFYADVFYTDDGKAIKVFLRRSDVSHGHVNAVFNSEVDAYQRIKGSVELTSLTPKFYGSIEVSNIKDAKGNDISSEYYLDLAYGMDKVEGDFVKIGTLSSGAAKSVYDLFKNYGVNHVCDASVVVANGVITSVIDFAVSEHELVQK